VEDIASALGIVVTYFDIDEYELMIVQDPQGELITIKINYNG